MLIVQTPKGIVELGWYVGGVVHRSDEALPDMKACREWYEQFRWYHSTMCNLRGGYQSLLPTPAELFQVAEVAVLPTNVLRAHIPGGDGGSQNFS